MTDFGRNSKGFNPGINYFSEIFSFNFERNKLCYFLEAERCILIILFKLIVQRQNEKCYINFSY